MDWSCFRMFNKVEEKKSNPLKVVLIVIGAIVAVGATAAVVYTVFKKYFTITFECSGDCENCDEDCLIDEEDEEEFISFEEEEVEAPEAAEEVVTE